MNPVGGEITESPAGLLTILVGVMHNFSMKSMGQLYSWINIIGREAEDCTVSKHMAHAKEIGRLVGNTNNSTIIIIMI